MRTENAINEEVGGEIAWIWDSKEEENILNNNGCMSDDKKMSLKLTRNSSKQSSVMLCPFWIKDRIKSIVKAGMCDFHTFRAFMIHNVFLFCFVFLQNRRTIQTQGNLTVQLLEQHIYLTIKKGKKFCSSSKEPLIKNWFSQWGSHILLVHKVLSHGMIFTTKLLKLEDLPSK